MQYFPALLPTIFTSFLIFTALFSPNVCPSTSSLFSFLYSYVYLCIFMFYQHSSPLLSISAFLHSLLCLLLSSLSLINFAFLPKISSFSYYFCPCFFFIIFPFSNFVFLFWLNFLRSPLAIVTVSISRINDYTRRCQQVALCPYKPHIMDWLNAFHHAVRKQTFAQTADTCSNSVNQDSCNVITQTSAHAQLNSDRPPLVLWDLSLQLCFVSWLTPTFWTPQMYTISIHY